MTSEPFDALALIRRFEPVLHYTSGELFFPMAVEDYIAGAVLLARNPVAGRPAEVLVEHGQLDADRLVAEARSRPDDRLYLHYARRSLDRHELREWRKRSDRPTFNGVSRLAAVGLFGRIIDSGMRLSLALRGRVPGGLTAASQVQYAASGSRHTYYARVSTDGGYVVLQYWFLYAMNDWRSTFGGVNDHECDWEQVTMFLAPGAAGEQKLAWVAFSSHDTTGDELRRRPDDPDISWIDGTHPVVCAGAGSHSGAYLAGDYLVRVQPPVFRRFFDVLATIRSALFPWTRNRPKLGVGIPYVDYRRGDGVWIGPGTQHPWQPILIDEDTAWVRDFRGLWGLDTEDPFGGERAPAGPRYERSGAIRTSWADPLGWAGLDKVPATAEALADARAARIAELDVAITEFDAEVAERRDGLRRATVGLDALPATATTARRGVDSAATEVAAREQEIAAVRTRRRQAVNERDQLRQIRDGAAPQPRAPHAHLRHREVPDTSLKPSTGALLKFWSGASLSVLLILLGLALLFDRRSIFWIVVIAVVVVMAIESVLQRRAVLFLLGLATTIGLVVLIWLLLTNIRTALGVLALVAAAAIGIANLRSLLIRP